MAEQQLQSRPLYGIGTVARLTGLKPDTLRVWERRYDLGASRKSDTGRRQYTQADLEHLQLVSALVKSGARIGEIAASERKTLERLVEACTDDRRSPAEDKPRVVFVGEALCRWLEDHQGCLSNVSAQLAAAGLAELDLELFRDIAEVDLLVVGCDRMGNQHFSKLRALRDLLQPAATLVLQSGMSDGWLKELASEGIAIMDFPPDRAELSFHLAHSRVERSAREGINSLSELVAPRPRLHSATQLEAAKTLTSGGSCECPRHLADLIASLAEFEAYSAECSVDNWQDAALHSCLYADTSQARWLMEKALDLVLQDHEQQQPRAATLKSA